MTENLNPIFSLLEAETPINITSELKETSDSVNKALSDACELALKQLLSGKQLVLILLEVVTFSPLYRQSSDDCQDNLLDFSKVFFGNALLAMLIKFLARS